MTRDLFAGMESERTWRDVLCRDAVVLRHFAVVDQAAILAAIRDITSAAPFRHMVTPGGYSMSVAMTNCGTHGWVTDRSGYRYDALDPQSGKPWPPMPELFRNLARDAALSAGFQDFEPDACLINHYAPGARLSLHQDKNERDFDEPIVSVSLGIPAVFLFGGLRRSDKPLRVPLTHGDVVVWGRAARLRYHGVLPLKEDVHPLVGGQRINLTFRKAG